MMMTKLHCPTCGVHIDEHPETPCLANWAAIDVMGWTETSPNTFVEPGAGHVYITVAPWNKDIPIIIEIKTVGELLLVASHFKVWQPQSDHSDAMMLVEKLDAEGWAVNILYYGNEAEVYFCYEIPRTAGADWVIAEPKCPGPLSLSLTRAAIKAKSE